MSEFHDIIADVVDDRAQFSTDAVVNLRTEETFIAEVEANPEAVLDTELGEDLREVVVLHVRNRTSAANINQEDNVRLTLFGQEVTLRITRRMDNPANPFVEFKAVKIVSNLDA